MHFNEFKTKSHIFLFDGVIVTKVENLSFMNLRKKQFPFLVKMITSRYQLQNLLLAQHTTANLHTCSKTQNAPKQ